MMAAPDKVIADEPQLEQLRMLRDAMCESLALKAKTAIQTVAGKIQQQDSADRYSLPGDDCAAFPVAGGISYWRWRGCYRNLCARIRGMPAGLP